MITPRIWKADDDGAPQFASDYDVLTRAVLQVTDIRTNRNKYYALELHAAKGASKHRYRVFTHYGRTDDLESNPDAGQKDCRYFASEAGAAAHYRAVYAEKTSARKGYREVALAASKIGSARARGQSAGEVDAATLARAASPAATARPSSALDPAVARLVQYLYAEATHALTTTVAATITAKGIETPLGVLTLGQIEKGEAILQALYEVFQAGAADLPRLTDLSGEFYSAVPHRIGRSRAAVGEAVIASMEAFEQKQETLQLMKDMLQVNGTGGRVLYDQNADARYEALGCAVRALAPQSDEYRSVADHVVRSQVRARNIRVKGVFTLRREPEWDQYAGAVGNEKLLFHGSRVKNWVGILSRGLVLPKIAVSMGVRRTDAGWLGNGIYFGDAACTSAQYTDAGREGTRFLAVTRVALGRVAEFRKITHGLKAPPAGHDSCHGVRARAGVRSDFADDEYVVYAPRQQRVEYLVEFAA